jgi:hypothetical protein
MLSRSRIRLIASVWLSLTGCPRVKKILSASLSWNGTIAAVKELEPTRVLAVTKLLRGPDWSGVAKFDEFARAVFIQPARDSGYRKITDFFNT